MATQPDASHYTRLAIQPFEYSFQNQLGPAEHTVVKYVSRWRHKGGIRDLRAAVAVLDILIEFEERQRDAHREA